MSSPDPVEPGPRRPALQFGGVPLSVERRGLVLGIVLGLACAVIVCVAVLTLRGDDSEPPRERPSEIPRSRGLP